MSKIVFPFRFKNLEDVLQDPENNPKEFMYGAYGLLKKHKDVAYFLEPKGSPRKTIPEKILHVLEALFISRAKVGSCFKMYLSHKEKAKSAERIICINDAIGFGFLFWKMLGALQADITAMFQGTAEQYLLHFSKRRLTNFFIKKMLFNANAILTLCPQAKELLNKHFEIPLEKIHVFRFGADTDFWKYKEYRFSERDDFILTIGNDLRRDYKIFFETLAPEYNTVTISSKAAAWKKSQSDSSLKGKLKQKLKIIIKGKDYFRIPEDEKTQIKTGISNQELKQLYGKARLLVIPCINLVSDFSGLSVTVQAMASGLPVLIAGTQPMRELFEQNKNILFYEPENPESLKKELEAAWDNETLLKTISRNARKLIEEKLNAENMTKQLEKILGLEEL